MSEIRFDDRVAIVTGAGGGLGREYALRWAQLGSKVLGNDFGGSPDGSGGSETPARSVVSEIEKAGGVAAASAETVDTPEGGRAIVEQALDLWGRVAVLVVAGGLATRLGFAGPKGLFPFGPITDRTLFELQAQKLRRVRERCGKPVPWYVMTSPETDAPTRAFFAENGNL